MDLRGAPRNKQGDCVYPFETDRGTSKRADVVLGYLACTGWATPTHTTFMVHAAAAAAARGAAQATKEYCMRRLVDTYTVRAVAAAPPLVPRPDA